MNRVQAGIAKIAAKCATLPVEKLNALKLDMEFDEYVKFQELKSLGSIDGTLSLEEAMTVYGYLGNTVEHFNAQPVPVKVVLTQLFAELIDRRIRSLQK